VALGWCSCSDSPSVVLPQCDATLWWPLQARHHNDGLGLVNAGTDGGSGDDGRMRYEGYLPKYSYQPDASKGIYRSMRHISDGIRTNWFGSAMIDVIGIPNPSYYVFVLCLHCSRVYIAAEDNIDPVISAHYLTSSDPCNCSMAGRHMTRITFIIIMHT
jgi:hypothetical protein